MNRTDEIDFLLTLDSHGWSTCWIVLDQKPIELTITHIFPGDPYVDLMDAFSKLIKGESLVNFFFGTGNQAGSVLKSNEIRKSSIFFKFGWMAFMNVLERK